jgi:ferrous iron transport protein B
MSSSKKTWLILGAPNSGKTSLYNSLTHSHEEVMNYPGSTVSLHTANILNTNITLIDTPGFFSLEGQLPEDEMVKKALRDYPNASILYVMDARFAEHRLAFLESILKLGRPCVVYVHFSDLIHLEERIFEKYEAPLVFDSDETALKTIHELLVHEKSPTSQKRILKKEKKWLENIDSFVLHPVLGFFSLFFFVFVLLMGAFQIAEPISEGIELIGARLVTLVSLMLQTFPLIASFSSAFISSFMSILMFVPQIFFLFFCIGWVQESGYLARAAVIVDAFFEKLGLSGKSFVSLLSGFSCAVPAILLSRTIESKRERFLTILATPFMMCSARLPMYALCIGFLFFHEEKWKAAIAFGACLLFNVITGCLASFVVHKRLKKHQTSSGFAMELPPYHLPKLKKITQNSWRRTCQFLRGIGKIIAAVSVFLWISSTFPKYDEPNAKERFQSSYLSHIGRKLEPVFSPMGADWRVGTALLTSFVARETVVSSLSLLLSESADDSRFIEKMHALKKEDGTPLFSFASVLALLVFFMLALQCGATVATIAHELKSWKTAITQFVLMNTIAYCAAVLVYQIAKQF